MIGDTLEKSWERMEAEILRLTGEVERLKRLNEGLAERVAAQSELLAERTTTADHGQA